MSKVLNGSILRVVSTRGPESSADHVFFKPMEHDPREISASRVTKVIFILFIIKVVFISKTFEGGKKFQTPRLFNIFLEMPPKFELQIINSLSLFLMVHGGGGVGDILL